jgi:hypothetical protein
MAATYQYSDQQILDSSGNPIVGATLESYASGTSTPLACYSDEALTTAIANPASGATTGNQVSGSDGRFGNIYLQALAYKFILKDSSGSTLWTHDTYNPDGGAASIGEVPDSSFRVVDNGDSTKKIAFEASGIATATTRTMTVPDFNGTLATLAGVETLSNKDSLQFVARSAVPAGAGVGSVAYSDGTDSTNGFGTDSGFQVFDGTQWATLTHAVPIERYGPGAGRGTVALDQVAFAAAATAGAMVSLRAGRTYYMHTGLTPAAGFGIEFGPGSKIVAVTQASGSGSDGFKNYSGLTANRNAVAGTMFMLTNAAASHTFVNPYFEGDNSNQPILRPIFAQGNTLNIVGQMTVRNLNACQGGASLNEMIGGYVSGLDVRGNADMVDSAYTDITNFSPSGLVFDDVGTYRSSGIDFGPLTILDLNRDSAGSDPRESDGVTLGGTTKVVRAGAREGHHFAHIHAENVGEAFDCFQSGNVVESIVIRNVLGFGVKFIHGAQNNIIKSVDIDGFYYAGVVFSGSGTATAHCSGNKILGGRIAGADAAANADACPVWITDNGAGTASVPKSNLVRGVDFEGHASSNYVVRSNLDATTAGAIASDEHTRIENCRNLGAAPVTAYALDAESTLDIDAASEFGDLSKRASATERGQVELATNAEVATGTDTARAVTPAGASAHFAPLSSPTFTNGYGATHASSNVVIALRRSEAYASDSDADLVLCVTNYQFENSSEATVTKFQEYYRAQGRTAGSESARKMFRVFSGASFRDHNINYDGFDVGSGAVYKVAGTQVVGAQQTTMAATAAATAYSAHASGAVAVTSNAATDLDTTAAAVATMRTELDALTTAHNLLLTKIKAHGLIA